MTTAWPPDLALLKLDMHQQGESGADDRDDAQLQLVLDAAVAYVERKRSDVNYTGDPDGPIKVPTQDLALGTVRLAWRWHSRRRSPDALIAMAEQGNSRVPSFDADIEKMLRVGRHARAVVA
ncbi:hypothetical protein [Labedaea rhizosphaerae]|uniref:Gp6-like head-tail connector protein n=1 Tax=Labedaea rhizosphaerae TaxID=598644 RepID=A0A4R6SCG9_LABRH|nr:hypothetical protein [Labedaea rhizosphaerae]TDP97651.1 hypothetical protein EV186_103615 [Labedaea rhizosphaerae]